jgi:plasmid stabilization system protein ParE
MKRRVFVRPEAEAELLEGALWYEANSPQSAIAFLEAFRSALVRISENPFQYQVIGKEIRRAPLARFPYGLLYAVIEDEVLVLSCFHGSRNPAQWRERFKR